MKEHRSSVLSKNMKSDLGEHVLKKIAHKIDFGSVKIIDGANNEKMRTVVEAVHIRMSQPSLNRQGGDDLPPVYTQLLGSRRRRGNHAKTGQPS